MVARNRREEVFQTKKQQARPEFLHTDRSESFFFNSPRVAPCCQLCACVLGASAGTVTL